MENNMQENDIGTENEMTEEQIVDALRMLNNMSELSRNTMTFQDAAFDNDRSEYIANVTRKLGPSPSRIPCKKVALTKGLGHDGKIHAIQIVNPAKQALKADRLRRKADRRAKRMSNGNKRF